MKKSICLALALLCLSACSAPGSAPSVPESISAASSTPAPEQETPVLAGRLTELAAPIGEALELPALLGSREVAFQTFRANSPYTLLAFREGQVVFSTWPTGTRQNDTRQFPYDEPGQLGMYTLGEPEARLLGPDEYFAASGQRPVLTAGGVYGDLYTRTEGLTGIAAEENGGMAALTQWQDRDAHSIQLSELDADRMVWYYSYRADSSNEEEQFQAAYVVTADGEAAALFDTGTQPFADGFVPLACTADTGRVLVAGRYPDRAAQVFLRVLDETGQTMGETALPVPERLQERGETDIRWMHAAGGYLFLAWSSPLDHFSVLCRQENGWAVVEHSETVPMGILQTAADGRYAFFHAGDHILAVDVQQAAFFRIPLPVCGEGRMLDSFAVDEQGRLLWSDRLTDGGEDADGRFYLAELVPLLEEAGA